MTPRQRKRKERSLQRREVKARARVIVAVMERMHPARVVKSNGELNAALVYSPYIPLIRSVEVSPSEKNPLMNPNNMVEPEDEMQTVRSFVVFKGANIVRVPFDATSFDYGDAP